MKALRLPACASAVAYLVRFRRPRDPPVFVFAEALPKGWRPPPSPGVGVPVARSAGSFHVDANRSGRIEARTGLRMMPTFPRPPLRFRTVGFPQYGSKAGLSDRAFPDRASVKLAPSIPVAWSGLPPPFVLSAAVWVLRSVSEVSCSVEQGSPFSVGDPLLGEAPPCERHASLYSGGPRSGPGYAVLDHHHLIDPIRPTRGHIAISSHSAYTRCLRCAGAPRRPASGSGLSLHIPSWHAILYDPGDFNIDSSRQRC
jgi:hypothetical protein